VGENVIAGADCGFSSRASSEPEVDAAVVWEKFRALAEGAAPATKRRV
jgi:5-methyltetrahydropteroyltriglutamate--homocysteine methyltransferase